MATSPSLFHRIVSAALLVIYPTVSLPVTAFATLETVDCAPAAIPSPAVRGGTDLGPAAESRFGALTDAFKEDWVPPPPVLTPVEIQVNRSAPVPGPDLKIPMDRELAPAEIKAAKVFDTPWHATGGGTAEKDTAALSRLLQEHAGGGEPVSRRSERLKNFALEHPDNPYSLSLLVESAGTEWTNGYFLKGLSTLRKAWEAGRGLTLPDDRRLAEMALGQLLERLALLGRKQELTALLEEVRDRELGGYADDARIRGREVLWFLNNRAERNMFCGFTAANAVCVPLGERPVFPDVHDEAEKAVFIRDGLSAFELKAHSHEAGGSLRVVKRASGAPVVVPSVIHWSFQHYSAITETQNGLYRVTDEHLRFNSWVPAEAIDQQASGYFLIPQAVKSPPGYTDVPDDEAKTIFGRHCTHARNTEGDQKRTDCDEDEAMASYSLGLLNPGLFLVDTPVSNVPAYGPPVIFRVGYNQRSVKLNDLDTVGNLGPRWTHSFNESVRLGGTPPGTDTPAPLVTWVEGSGDYYDYEYDTPGSVYKVKFKERPRMSYLNTAAGGPGYQLTFTDGSRKLFKQPNASPAGKYLLTHIVDPVGNTVTLNYDVQLRLATIVDALSQTTTLDYGVLTGDNVPGDTKKIRKVRDHFLRQAVFKYTATGQLEKIIDPVEIVSQFHYGAGDVIDRLTTPYGVTEFRQGDIPGLNAEPGRFIEAIDSQGGRERVEGNDFALPTTYAASPLPPAYSSGAYNAQIPVNGVNVPFMAKTDYLFYRNTFHWNRQQMKYWPGDYTKCRIYNWLASGGDTVTSVLGSVKDPLEGRVWFNYPDQLSKDVAGSIGMPSKVVRAVENSAGTTSWTMSQATYNQYGLLTGSVDPEGREMKYEYHTVGSGFDERFLRYVKVKDAGGSWITLSEVKQYKTVSGTPVLLPEIIKTADGAETQATYNSRGQVTEIKIFKTAASLSETTKFIYTSVPGGAEDGYGYLKRVEQTSPWNPTHWVVLASYTYDTVKRVRTITNAQGYTLTYDYDNLDRVTLVTHPDATTQQFVYTNGASQTLDVWAVKERDNTWSRIRYNHLRQPVAQIDPLLRLTQINWCLCGSVSSVIDAAGKTTSWKRDAQGRVTEKLLPDGKQYFYTYQPLSGRLATAAYPKDAADGHWTFNQKYRLDGTLQQRQYYAGAPTVTFGAPDFLGRPTTITDGTGTTTRAYVPIVWGADTAGAGSISTVNGPRANDTLRYSYDWQGRRVKSEIVADDGVTVSRSVAMTFDSLSRITQTVSNLGTFNSVYNTGNLSGFPDSISQPGPVSPNNFNTLLASYPASAGANALGLQTVHYRQGTSTVQKHDYAYNISGNLSTWGRTDSLGTVNQWVLQHDPSGQLTSLDEKLNGVAQNTDSWTYDPAGNMTSLMSLPASGSGTLKMRFHTARNQLTRIGGNGKTMVEGTVNEASKVTVNGAAAAVQKLGPSGPWRFQKEVDFVGGPNAFSISATDGTGNTKTSNYTVSVGTTIDQRLEYDANGNLTAQKNASLAVIRAFTWDAENRLLSVQSPGTVASGTKKTEFTYDAFGRRATQKESLHNGSAWVVQSQWTFIWDGMELAQKRNTSGGAILASYFTNGEQQGADLLVFQPDHLGSVRNWYRVSDGQRGSATFTAFGQRTVTVTGPGVPERGYTGHFHHGATGLLLAPLRAYDPDLGRWICEDPMGESGGLNLYGYVGNSPTGFMDPDGRLGWFAAAGIGALVGGVIGGVAAAVRGEDWDGIGRAALTGAISGGVAGLTLGLGGCAIAGVFANPVVGAAAAGAISSAAGDAAAQGFEMAVGLRCDFDEGQLALSAAGGALVGGVMAKLSSIPGLCFETGTEIATAEGGRPIESLRTGDRVLTEDQESSTDVNPQSWRRIVLTMPNPEFPADILDIELLRPLDWIEATGSHPGARIDFEIEEMGLRGPADVISIGECPPVQTGRGRVVLATVTHLNSFVMEMKFEGRTGVLKPTDRHHLFSLTRNDWVPAAEFQPGELLQTAYGPVRLASVTPLPGTRRVHNLEVETNHCYFAGENSVLSHNAKPCGKFLRDEPTDNTKNWSAKMNSEREARALAKTKLGKNPVEVEPNKWRSADGRWQYRAKPGDVSDGHVHLEELNPSTGEVLQNLHLRW